MIIRVRGPLKEAELEKVGPMEHNNFQIINQICPVFCKKITSACDQKCFFQLWKEVKGDQKEIKNLPGSFYGHPFVNKEIVLHRSKVFIPQSFRFQEGTMSIMDRVLVVSTIG